MELKELSENIKNNLTIEDVKNLLFSLGGDPAIKNNIIIARTICHAGHSHKLYYYENTHLFKCYTDCPEDSFDIFELVIKIKKNDNIDISLPQAVNYITNFFNLSISTENFLESKEELEDWKILNKYAKNNSKEKEEKKVELKFYDEKILKYLPHPRIIPWEQEGITKEVMDYYDICYDPIQIGRAHV